MGYMTWNQTTNSYEGATSNGRYFVRVDGDEISEAIAYGEKQGMTREVAEQEALIAEHWLDAEGNPNVEIEEVK